MRRARRVLATALLAAALLLVPDAASTPARLSLVKVEGAKAVDFADGIVWVLALGSDARAGENLFEAQADAIQLIGLDFESGAAVAIGVLRDFWVNIPDHGFAKINAGLRLDGPQLMARLVESLVGIRPQYVVTAGFEGFGDVIDAIDGIVIRSKRAFTDPEHGITIGVGPNHLDGERATAYARSRSEFLTADYERSANHQEILRAILEQVRGQEDVAGFIEGGAMAVFRGLDAEISPVELYKFAQAITQLQLRKVTLCRLGGRDEMIEGLAVVIPDDEQARRVGREARDDATLESGC